jgi:hypothetical protein
MISWIERLLRRLDQEVASRSFYPTIEIKARKTASGVEVFGATDLPDGTFVKYEVGTDPAFERDTQRGQAVVRDGAYMVAFSPSPWRSQSLAVVISVRASASQPATTQAVLGTHGERMAADVTGAGHSEYFATETVQVQPEDR